MADADSTKGWSSALLMGIVLAMTLALGILGALSPSIGSENPTRAEAVVMTDSTPVLPAMARDIRVRAILEGYGVLFDSVRYLENDVVFSLPGGPVYFQEGRMLGEEALEDAEAFDPLFYSYSLSPLRAPVTGSGEPVYSRDLLRKAFGNTEHQIREHGVSARFLDRRVYVNAFCLNALKAVERDLRSAAGKDPEVRRWIDEIDIAYSFIDKTVAGSRGRSHHAWGMAIDLVPTSYGGRHVYWRWSRVFNRERWSEIPLEERWSPPQAVIDAFERHGFVWGGKWYRFDTIHFEYRPEILAYNRLLNDASS